jgi:hypothetical protein
MAHRVGSQCGLPDIGEDQSDIWTPMIDGLLDFMIASAYNAALAPVRRTIVFPEGRR